MNFTELLEDLQSRQHEAAARVVELRDRIEHLTAALTETEARVVDLATARKVIAGLSPTGYEPDPPETTPARQAILNAFNQRTFRVHELHELLGMPSDDPHLNTIRNASDSSPSKSS